MKTLSVTGILALAVGMLGASTSLACNHCDGHAQPDRLAMAGRRPLTTTAAHAEAQADEAATKPAKALKPQTTCPVMKGGPINPDLYVDYDGKRIHVCCAGCDDVVKADPAKAIATLAEQGQAPRQALCPIMDRPIDTDQYVDHEGKRIYVCCAGCIARVKADPEAALKKLHEQGVAPAKAGDEPETDTPAHDHGHHHHH